MTDEYEDDFEDYEDDFEDFEPEETSSSAKSFPKSTEGHNVRREQNSQAVNISQHCLQRKKLLSKGLLTVTETNLYEAPPLTKYDLSMLGQGHFRNLRVSSCQTVDSALGHVGCQTEGPVAALPSTASQGHTQGPEPSASGRSTPPQASEPNRGVRPGEGPSGGGVSQMASFILDRGALVSQVIEQSVLGSATMQVHQQEQSVQPSVFGSYAELSAAGFNGGRRLSRLAFCSRLQLLLASYRPTAPQRLLFWGASDGSDAAAEGMGCVCIWALSSLVASHVLVCEGSPTCICVSDKPGVVVAGLEAGGLCLWSLKGSAAQGLPALVDGELVTCSKPLHSTELDAKAEHTGPIVAVAWLPSAPSGAPVLCALDSLGGFGVWMVAKGQQQGPGEPPAALQLLSMGYQSLLCRRFGFCAEHTGSVPAVGLLPAVAAVSLAISSPAGALGTCWVALGTDTGQVLCFNVAAGSCAPREHLTGDASMPAVGQRVPLQFSPFLPDVFAAGHGGAVIAVHRVGHRTPLLLYQGVSAGSMLAVRWSPVRPGVLFVLDSDSVLSVFDLSSSARTPADQISVRRSGSTATALEVLVPTPGGGSRLAVGYSDGAVQLYRALPAYDRAVLAELETVTAVLLASS